jgi:uncharacterized membrane protein YdjX (TVP38/TMEM64 family)
LAPVTSPPAPNPRFAKRWWLLATTSLCVAGTYLWLTNAGLAANLLNSHLTPSQKIVRLQQHFAELGAAAPAMYVLLVTLEVVIAPIPGAILYAPGGVIFGGFWGGFLSLLANVLGASIACLLMRHFGTPLRRRLQQNDQFRATAARLATHGTLVVALLRINPLTSSDLVSYAAGLTPMPLWKLCLGTAIGMAPLCWLQSYAADQLLTAYPHLLTPLIVVSGLYLLIFLLLAILRRLSTRSSLIDESAVRSK